MEAELMALATAGATALVQQMVGDGWERARTRIAAFFAARSGADPETVGEELEAAREDLLRAESVGDETTAGEARAEARIEWRARMRRSLLADPESAGELRSILEELEGGAGNPQPQHTTIISNSMHGGVHHNITLQVGTIGRVDWIGNDGVAGSGGAGGQDGPRP
ncbi:hypothetical protein ACFW6S_12135 [Streptomyces sp. NPDC058740]|uniref:hypothetical protein n=1 Tax=Streptomyces sp. NPDC058740 TaxID=3346619 RepID=UPI0036C9FDF0